MRALRPAAVAAMLALAGCAGETSVSLDPTPRLYDEPYAVDGVCFKDNKAGRPHRVAPGNCGLEG